MVVGRVLTRPALEQASGADALRLRSQRLLGGAHDPGGIASFRRQAGPCVPAVVAAPDTDRTKSAVHAQEIDGAPVHKEIGGEAVVYVGQERPTIALVA